MTTTYDPFEPAYWDEADLRGEMTRVFDLCHGCRLCSDLCPAFPTLFDLIDRHDDQDAARLTPDEQDAVVHECFSCKRCYLNCPYTPEQHEWAIDFPRLMLRSEQVRVRNRRPTVKARLTDQLLGRTDLAGKLGTTAAPWLNRFSGTPGSPVRRLVARTAGIAAERVLPPYAKQRFSTWFEHRMRSEGGERPGSVALFPTCIVEYQHPAIGHDLVKVYERNGIDCSLPEGQVCCGAPWLHAGDVESFRKQARTNIDVLAAAVRDGRDVVVPQPTCSYVIKKDYVDYVGGADASTVASRTFDAAEYLMRLHGGDGPALDTDFTGEVPAAVTYHAPCHLRAQDIGLQSRDLLQLTGTEVTVVAECSGIDGTWGYREEHYEASRGVAHAMAEAIERAGNDTVVGDCHLANGGIVQETGMAPLHPMQLLAQAYGIPEER